jgi:hypothetical protein
MGRQPDYRKQCLTAVAVDRLSSEEPTEEGEPCARPFERYRPDRLPSSFVVVD